MNVPSERKPVECSQIPVGCNSPVHGNKRRAKPAFPVCSIQGGKPERDRSRFRKILFAGEPEKPACAVRKRDGIFRRHGAGNDGGERQAVVRINKFLISACAHGVRVAKRRCGSAGKAEIRAAIIQRG